MLNYIGRRKGNGAFTGRYRSRVLGGTASAVPARTAPLERVQLADEGAYVADPDGNVLVVACPSAPPSR